MKTGQVNCFKCQHFYVTWDQNFPRGCKIFGFKTRQIPSVLVWQSTGKDCLAFEEKGCKSETGK